MASSPAWPVSPGAGAALALAAAAMLNALTGAAGAELLDEVVADYLEDAETPRPVAEVRAGLLRRSEGLFLRLVVSADGAGVDAVPGLHGVRGHNLRTAELEGGIRVVRYGRQPRRSIGGDGALRLHGETDAEWPLEVAFEGGPMTLGSWRAYVLADGVPRLRAVVEADADDPRIAELESLGQFNDPRSSR